MARQGNNGNGNGNGNGNDRRSEGQNEDQRGQGQGQGRRNPSRPKFVVGETVNVWKLTGVRDLKMGPSTSERPGGDYPDIDVDEPLKVVETRGAKALVKREDGQKVWIHINHIWKESKYYEQRGQGRGQGQEQGQQARGERQQSQQRQQMPSRETVKQKLENARIAYEEALSELESASEDLPFVTENGEVEAMNG